MQVLLLVSKVGFGLRPIVAYEKTLLALLSCVQTLGCSLQLAKKLELNVVYLQMFIN